MADKLILIRHGETDWNREARLQGKQDIPINARGREQARRNGGRLAGFLAAEDIAPESLFWVASPLGRARETMEIIRTEMGLPRADYAVDPTLAEISFGAWEGFTYDELSLTVPELVAERLAAKWAFVPPRGESYEMLSERATTWLSSQTGSMIVVSHGGIMRVVIGDLLKLDVADIPDLDIPQDRFFVWENGEARWV